MYYNLYIFYHALVDVFLNIGVQTTLNWDLESAQQEGSKSGLKVLCTLHEKNPEFLIHGYYLF
jgi:hypothetical protein